MRIRWTAIALSAAALLVLLFQAPGLSQVRQGEGALTYTHGQSVMPVYQGWTENPDGTFNTATFPISIKTGKRNSMFPLAPRIACRRHPTVQTLVSLLIFTPA